MAKIGRPTVPSERRKFPRTVSFDLDTLKAVRAMADLEKTDISNFMRGLIMSEFSDRANDPRQREKLFAAIGEDEVAA